MSDPLSVAASVAGLAMLARDVAKGIKHVIDTVQGANEEMRSVYNHVVALLAVLEGVGLVLEHMGDGAHDRSTPRGIISECSSTLERLKQALRRFAAKDIHSSSAPSSVPNQTTTNIGGENRHWKKLKQGAYWFFKKEEVEKLCGDLDSQKQTLSLAITKESMWGIIQVLSQQKDTSDDIADIKKVQAEIRASQMDEIDYRSVQERERVLDSFSTLNETIPLGKHLSSRQEGTGSWFLNCQEYQQFLATDNSQLWLHGIPGAGKSVLSATIIESAIDQCDDRKAVVYFFCEHSNPETTTTHNILASLARQLASKHRHAFADVLAFFRDGSLSNRMRTDEGPLLELIWRMSCHWESVIAVIDGLDECRENSHHVSNTLVKLSQPDDGNIKTLLVSRVEEDIQRELSSFQQVEISANKEDVRLFVASMLSTRFSTMGNTLKLEVLDFLVEKSEGMFQWVKCQLDYLHDLPSNKLRKKALKELPPDLPSTYESILVRATEAAPEFTLLFLERMLRWIALAKRPLSTKELEQAVSLDEDDTELDDSFDLSTIIRHCRSLVRTTNDRVSFSHFTVREFLLNIKDDKGKGIGRFRVDVEQDNESIGLACLDYLLMNCFHRSPPTSREEWDKLMASYSLYQYAAANWFQHASNPTNRKDRRSSRVFELFHVDKSDPFVFWALDCALFRHPGRIRPNFGEASDVNPLHLACACGKREVVKFLIQHKVDVNSSSRLFGTPLECAINCWLTDAREEVLLLVRDLLQEGLSKSLEIHDPLFAATKIEDSAITLELLQHGFPVSEQTLSRIADLTSRPPLDSDVHARMNAFVRTFTMNIDDDSLTMRTESLLKQIKLNQNEVFQPRPLGRTRTLERDGDTEDPLETLRSAASYGQRQKLEKAISSLPVMQGNRRQYLLSQCLLDAAKKGHCEAVELLLQNGADVNYRHQSHGGTALHGASVSSRIDVVRILVRSEIGAADNIRLPNYCGNTPWMLAVMGGSVEILKLFVAIDSGIDFNITNIYGTPAINVAVSSGHGPMFHYLSQLIPEGASEAPNIETLFQDLAKVGLWSDKHLELALQLFQSCLEKYQDSTIARSSKFSPLHFLAGTEPRGPTKLCTAAANIERLKALSATGMATLDPTGNTPVHLALERHWTMWNEAVKKHTSYWPTADTRECFDFLVALCKLGGEDKSHLLVSDSKGRIPLLSFAKTLSLLDLGNKGRNINYDERFLGLFRILLPPPESDRERISQPDCDGKTLLQYLTDWPFNKFPREICDSLSQYKFDFSQKDSDGNTALLCAAASTTKNVSLLRFLLAKSPPELLEEPNAAGLVAIQLICKHRKPGVDRLISSISPLIAASTSVDESGRTSLMQVGQVLDDPVIASLITSLAGSNAEVCDSDGLNALWYACKFGSNAMISALVDNGVTICGSSERAPSALIVAALFGHSHTVQFLLETVYDPLVPCQSGWTLQHVACVGFPGSDLWILEHIVGIDYEAKIVPRHIHGLELTNEDLRDLEGCTPLHVAASFGNYEAVDWLLKSSRTSDKDAETNHGATALHLACLEGCLRSCTTLIKAGASTSKADNAGRTPLHLACERGHDDICESLLSADVPRFLETVNGETPLDLAVKNGHIGVVQLLLKAGDDIPDGIEIKALEADRPEIAALVRGLRTRKSSHIQPEYSNSSEKMKDLQNMLAGVMDEDGALEMLEKGLDPNARHAEQWGTPLHVASHYGSVRVLKKLLSYECEIEAKDSQGYTSIMCAVQNGHLPCIKMLHDHGARLDKRRWSGSTLLHIAAGSGRADTLSYLLRHGLDPNLTNIHGDTASHLATTIGCFEALIHYGADMFISSKDGFTLIHTLCRLENSSEQLGMVLSIAPRVKTSQILEARLGFHGCTLLYEASYRGNIDAARVFIQHGADVNQIGGPRGTPIQAALGNHGWETTSMLLDRGARPYLTVRGDQKCAAWYWEFGYPFSFQDSNGRWDGLKSREV